jgi:serine/threonine protein kinase
MRRERALDVAAQVARALDAIHAHGVIHRDLKPGNVMLRANGSVVLADFGVARSMLQEEGFAPTLPRDADVVGTPFYLSPEQASGQPITPASDLYSLGVMLHEMLTGERPYRGESLDLLLSQHLSAPVPRLPAQHADLQPVLDKLMAKQPQQRYPSARALLDALAQLRGRG